jgi:hypothetical protein
MALSDNFKRELTTGNVAKAFEIALTEAIHLEITTWVATPTPQSQSELSQPGARIRTRLNLVDGRVDHEVGTQFLDTGPYAELREFHLKQVQEGRAAIQSNIRNLKILLETWLQLQQLKRPRVTEVLTGLSSPPSVSAASAPDLHPPEVSTQSLEPAIADPWAVLVPSTPPTNENRIDSSDGNFSESLPQSTHPTDSEGAVMDSGLTLPIVDAPQVPDSPPSGQHSLTAEGPIVADIEEFLAELFGDPETPPLENTEPLFVLPKSADPDPKPDSLAEPQGVGSSNASSIEELLADLFSKPYPPRSASFASTDTVQSYPLGPTDPGEPLQQFYDELNAFADTTPVPEVNLDSLPPPNSHV